MYWKKDEKRKRIVCGWVDETQEHVWDSCMRGKEERGGWKNNFIEILDEKGREEDWMNQVKEVRGDKEEEENVEESLCK